MSVAAQRAGRPLLVRVAIPHFFHPSDQGNGYGSTRADARVHRAIALGRCLGATLALAREAEEDILHLADRCIAKTPARRPGWSAEGIRIDCHVFVTGDDWLPEVLGAFSGRLTVHRFALDDPRRLPQIARNFLLTDAAEGEADLSLYLEDDLVIQDRLYLDKLAWFAEHTTGRYVLMPHRFEQGADARLFVDGPLDASHLPRHQQPAADTVRIGFPDGQCIGFDIAANPHSGSFALSRPQRQWIASRGLSEEVFIGPLETVATWTVLQHFPVLKPAWRDRDFLLIEHAHPSFLYLRGQWPGAARALPGAQRE